MTEEHEPGRREHDHLVEPLFAALRQSEAAEDRRDRRRGRRSLLVVGLLGAIAMALAVRALLDRAP